jgi:hypothetical protein
VFFFLFFHFLFLPLFLYFPTIKVLVHSLTTLPLPLGPSILTFAIILFENILPTVPSVQTGYLLPIYLPISSRNHYPILSLCDIVHLLGLFSFDSFSYFFLLSYFSFSPLSPDGGVLDVSGHRYYHALYHVTLVSCDSRVLHNTRLHLFSFPQLSTTLFPLTLRRTYSLSFILYITHIIH